MIPSHQTTNEPVTPAATGSPSLDAEHSEALRNNRAISSERLRSDSSYQAKVHAPHQQHRRRLIAALIGHAEAEEDPTDLNERHPARKLAGRLTDCCRHPTLYQRQESGELVIAQARCKSRICPRCGIFRRNQLEHRIRALLQKASDTRLLTLTIKSTDYPLADQIAHLRQSFTRLRRRADWKKHVAGGVTVFEITWNPTTEQWHPHLHCIIDGKFWPQAKISTLWLKCTGDSSVVDIRRIASREALTQYVTKYVTKTQLAETVPARHTSAWALAVHGLRLCQAFGKFHGMADEIEEKTDPTELDNIAPLEALAYEADAGDLRARRLFNAVVTLAGRRIPDDNEAAASTILARHRSFADRVRSWWSNQQEHNRVQIPSGPDHSSVDRHPRHRTLRLWEEPVNSPSALVHGM